MSSIYLDNVVENAADRILMLLKTRGPQTARDIGAALAITGEGARQHLKRLASDGLVDERSESKGVGRPRQLWQLTEKANSRFPDTHSTLTVQLLQSIRNELGESALDRLIASRDKDIRSSYESALTRAKTIEERVKLLAEIRAREGYMAEWKREGKNFVLIENHCPICFAATTCQQLCRSELQIFQEVLGSGVRITRTEHIPHGARRCAYLIEVLAKQK